MSSPATEVVLRSAGALRRSAAWWTFGALVFVVVNLAFWPSLESSDALTSLEESSGGLLEAFGAGGIATPAGYLDGQVFALMLPLILSAMAITAVSGLTAGDEDAGRLELLHALPVSRPVLWLGRLAAGVGAVVTVTVVVAAVTVACLSPFSLDGVSVARVVAATAACGLLGLLHGTVAYAAAGAGASRARSASIAVLVLVLGYVLAFVFPLSDTLAPLRRASPWYWAIGTQPVTDGVSAVGVLAVVVAATLLVVLGTVLQARRDVRAA